MSTLRKTSALASLLIIGVVGIVVQTAAAAGNQEVLPPGVGQTISPPLTTSSNAQQKAGSVLIGPPVTGAPSKLCLNASGLADTSGNCISTWSDLTDQLPQYVRIRTNGISVTPDFYENIPAMDYANYLGQSNFAVIQSKPESGSSYQAYAAAIQAPVLGYCSYDQGEQFGTCTAGPNLRNACTTNFDCGFAATAVRASSSATSNVSADFHGTVLVKSAAAQLYAPAWGDSNHGRICLNGILENPINDNQLGANGENGPPCITSWKEVSGATKNVYVIRQYTTPPAYSQPLGAAISGDAQFGGAIVGSAAGIDSRYTCGDGMCNGSETATVGNLNFCAIDCLNAGTPLIDAQVTMNSYPSPQVSIYVSVGNQTQSTPYMVIVRSLSATPSFRPVDGYSYAANQVFGNEKVLFAGSQTANTQFYLIDALPLDSGSNHPTYYYAVYQANGYPKYGVPAVAQVKLAVVTASINMNGFTVGPVNGIETGMMYQCSSKTCHGYYNVALGAVSETLGVITQLPNYRVTGWQGCSNSGVPTCNVAISADMNVSVNLVSASGGGGGGPPIDSGGDPNLQLGN